MNIQDREAVGLDQICVLTPTHLCFVLKMRGTEGGPKPQQVSLEHLQVSLPESFLVSCEKFSRVGLLCSWIRPPENTWCGWPLFLKNMYQLICCLWVFTLTFPLPETLFFDCLFHLGNWDCFSKSQFRCHFIFPNHSLFSHRLSQPTWDRFPLL